MPDPDAALAEILNPLVSGYRQAGAMSLVAAVREAGWRPRSEVAARDDELWFTAWNLAAGVLAAAAAKAAAQHPGAGAMYAKGWADAGGSLADAVAQMRAKRAEVGHA